MKNLPQIIRDNPGATLRVDNDNWHLLKAADPTDPEPVEPVEDDAYDEWSDRHDEWSKRQELACSRDDFEKPEHGLGCYGEGMLHALAGLAGIKVENV